MDNQLLKCHLFLFGGVDTVGGTPGSEQLVNPGPPARSPHQAHQHHCTPHCLHCTRTVLCSAWLPPPLRLTLQISTKYSPLYISHFSHAPPPTTPATIPNCAGRNCLQQRSLRLPLYHLSGTTLKRGQNME